MNQNERLDFLIDAFKEDSLEYKNLKVPDDMEGKKRILRSLMNIRMPRQIKNEVLQIQDDYLKERIENGLLYIGESAGSVIAAPNIEYASIVDDKTLATELDDYTGLDLVDFYIVPHFEEEPFVESSRNTVELYKDKLDLKLINNKEAILVENNNFTIIK